MAHNFEMDTGTHTAGIEHTVLALLILGVLASSSVFFHAIIGLPISFPTQGLSSDESVAGISAPVTTATAKPTVEPPRSIQNTYTAVLPSRVVADVPFTPQAPHKDWSPPWDEACEEASILMVMDWIRNTEIARDPDAASSEIENIIAFEDSYFGYHNDTDIRTTAKIISRYYRHAGVEVVYDITIDDIRRKLAEGNLLILPFAGALLKNPNFDTPPPYHMAVAIGYDDTAREFIVHEPGTRRGEAYRYSYETIRTAVHDWTGSDATMSAGRSGMIVVSPEK